MSWLLSYSGKELHNIFSFLPILYHYIPFISRITIHLSHVSSFTLEEHEVARHESAQLQIAPVVS